MGAGRKLTPHGRRQRQLGREGSPIQSGNHLAAAGHRAQRVEQRKVLLRLGRNVAERRTAAAHLHIHARTPRHAQRPLGIDIPHDARIDAYGHIGRAFEPCRHQRFAGMIRREITGSGIGLTDISVQSGDLSGELGRRGQLLQLIDLCLQLARCQLKASGCRGTSRRDGKHRTRQIEITPRDHQTRTDRHPVAELERHGRLHGIGRQIDLLHQIRTGTVVAPVHRRAVGREETQADGPAVGRFVVEIGVDRRRHLVVGLPLGTVARIETVLHRGRRGIGTIGKDSRSADRQVEFRILERRGSGVEEDGFRIEFHGRADMAHTRLAGREVVYLIALGPKTGRRDDGHEKRQKSFHSHKF